VTFEARRFGHIYGEEFGIKAESSVMGIATIFELSSFPMVFQILLIFVLVAATLMLLFLRAGAKYEG
jgi:hypothetical protein